MLKSIYSLLTGRPAQEREWRVSRREHNEKATALCTIILALTFLLALCDFFEQAPVPFLPLSLTAFCAAFGLLLAKRTPYGFFALCLNGTALVLFGIWVLISPYSSYAYLHWFVLLPPLLLMYLGLRLGGFLVGVYSLFLILAFSASIPSTIFDNSSSLWRIRFFTLFLSAIIFSIISEYMRHKTHRALQKARCTLKQKNTSLSEQVTQRTKELNAMQDALIIAMASLAERRDDDTASHIRRVQMYIYELAKYLQTHSSYSEILTNEFIDILYKTAPLHDIGKVGVPDRILLKTSLLTPQEFDIMKKHTRYGRDAIIAAENELQTADGFLTTAKEITYSHHERWDGRGYPLGLKEQEIPLSARLMAIADVYDALTTKRTYKTSRGR